MKLPVVSAKTFWTIAVVLHLLCFSQALHSGSIYLVDSVDYLSQATNLAQHGSLYAAPWNGPFRVDYFTFRPPVYGLFILICKFIYANDYSILFMQALISLSTLFGILKLAGKLGLNINNTRLFLVLVLVFYPSQLIHCNFVMSDILFQSLLFWAFYFSYQLLHYQTYKNAFISVLFFMLAMLTKPVAFLLGFTLLLVLAIAFSRKNKIKYVLPFLLLPLTYHAYCSYNERVTGYYHYSSVTPVFVLKYMAKYTNAQLFGEAHADSVQDHIMAIANAQVVYADRYNLMNVEGAKIITAHKVFFMWFNIKGWAAFMLDPGRFEWVHFLNLKEGNYPGLYHVINTEGLVNGLWIFIKNAPLVFLLILLISFIWNAFMSALLLVFFFGRNISWQLRLWVFLFVAYIIGSTGVLGLSRYRIAVAPMLWIAAMYVIQLWLIHRSDRKEILMYVD